MSKVVFWSGHNCFGDCFCVCAAAHCLSKKIGEPVHVSFWEPFKHLADFFNNIIWIPRTEQKCEFIFIDVGQEPNFLLTNGVCRFYNLMCAYVGITPIAAEVDIQMNISSYEKKPYISIAATGNKNGMLNPLIMDKMLKRAHVFYPQKEIIFIGHFQNDFQRYKNLIEIYNIKDLRTTDRTCDVVMEQLRSSALLVGVHTGLVYPALGMKIPVWCEHSIDSLHDFCLDFPSSKPLFFKSPYI